MALKIPQWFLRNFLKFKPLAKLKFSELNAHEACYNPLVRKFAHSGRKVEWHFFTQALAWHFLSHSKRPEWANSRTSRAIVETKAFSSAN